MHKKQKALLVLASVIGCATCNARTPGSPLRPGFNTFNKQQDVQLGLEASQQVRKQYQAVQNQFLQNYINRIGQRLAAQPEAKNSGFPFTFTVINDPTVNAFALPGGPMFIQTGLLKAVDNEAELAGVMGHEMSHVILRHGTNQASKANLIQLPAMLAGAVAGGSMLGSLAQLGIGLGANSVLLRFSRSAESEADALGSHLMAEAGYDPIQMARFFQKLNESGGSRGPQFLSDHPNPGNREKDIEAEVKTLPQHQYGYETGDFQRMKQELGQVPNQPPAAAGNGFRNTPALPDGQATGGMKEIRGSHFSLQYPSSWQAYGGDSSDSLTIAPRNGIVQGNNGSSSVGYGAIVNYFSPDNQGNQSLAAATDDLIHHLRAQNSGMEVAGNSQAVRVGGRPGMLTLLQSNSPFGNMENDQLLTVSTPQGLFYVVFIAPEAQFGKLQPTFQQMMQSIQFSR